jgi:hypothetical protein
MKCGYELVLILLLAAPTAWCEQPQKEVIKVCNITLTPQAKEADFTVVYRFEMKNGRATKIQRMKDDFLSGRDVVACISEWRIPSLLGVGVAEFTYKHDQGWVVVAVTGRNFSREVRNSDASPD